MRDFKRLEIWEISRELNKTVYLVSKKFPKDEVYGLTSQIRRASISISSNIAEGCGRRTSKDFVQFSYNALGSLKEVESQVFVAKDLGYISEEGFDELSGKIAKLGRKLSSFIKYIREGGV
jgi:four helix bundle protein